MTNKCSVPNCKTNYNSQVKHTGVLACFAFPRDPKLRAEWLKRINRENFMPTKYSCVCERHFRSEDFRKIPLTEEQIKDAKLRPKRTLLPGVVPSIIAVKNIPVFRQRGPNKPRSEFPETAGRIMRPPEDKIPNFEEFKSKIRDWLVGTTFKDVVLFLYKGKKKVAIFLMFDDEITIDVNVKIIIDEQMDVQVDVKRIPVIQSVLKEILPKYCRLSYWSQLKELLIKYKTRDENVFRPTVDQVLDKSIKSLAPLGSYSNFRYKKQLRFTVDQLMAMRQSKADFRLSATLTLNAFKILSNSDASYNMLSPHMLLPSKAHLQIISEPFKLMRDYTVESNFDQGIRYFADTTRYLLNWSPNEVIDREKYVLLHIEEIYGQGDNFDETGPKPTVHCYTVKSPFGTFNEIIRIIPILQSTSNQLYLYTMKILEILHSLRFVVIGICTNYNKMYRGMFQAFLRHHDHEYDALSFQNPNAEEGHEIFIIPDSTVAFNQLKENWMSLDTPQKSFMYPDPDSESNELRTACLSHVLKYETILPQRRDAPRKLTNQIFLRSTINGLLKDEESKETAQFIDIMMRWWDFFTVKSKGDEKEANLKPALVTQADERFKVMQDFVEWLNDWRDFNEYSVLTVDIYMTMVQTTQACCKLFKTFLDNSEYSAIKYILPGKFQGGSMD